MRKPRIAILASGEGTTAETFIRAGAKGKIEAQVSLVICNKPEAGIFDRVKALNKEYGLAIQAVHISHQTHPAAADEQVAKGGQTRAEEAAIMDALLTADVDLVCLMGYLRRVGPKLVKRFGALPSHSSPYQAMMLNTHPGLLPDSKGFWGIHAQEHVLEQHLPYSGQTLIVVAEAYDDGTTIAEHKVAVLPDDTPESLFARVQATEKKYLPTDIDNFIKQRRAYLSKGQA